MAQLAFDHTEAPKTRASGETNILAQWRVWLANECDRGSEVADSLASRRFSYLTVARTCKNRNVFCAVSTDKR